MEHRTFGSTPADSANSVAAAPGVMRSKQPHSLRMGICWATRARTSVRWSMAMSRLPMGMVWPTVRMLRRTSGRTERTVENMRPMKRSGRSKMTAAIMSAMGAMSGAKGEIIVGKIPCRSRQAGVLTPSR